MAREIKHKHVPKSCSFGVFLTHSTHAGHQGTTPFIAVVPSRLTHSGSWHVERTRGTAVEEGARTGGLRTPYIEAAGEEERETQREKECGWGRDRDTGRASERRLCLSAGPRS